MKSLGTADAKCGAGGTFTSTVTLFIINKYEIVQIYYILYMNIIEKPHIIYIVTCLFVPLFYKIIYIG